MKKFKFHQKKNQKTSNLYFEILENSIKMDEKTCFLCKSAKKNMYTTQFNCLHHTQAFIICGQCEFDLDVCSFCENSKKNPIEKTVEKTIEKTIEKTTEKTDEKTNEKTNEKPLKTPEISFLFLVNFSINNENSFPLIKINPETQENSIFYICSKPKSGDFQVYSYAGISPINQKEFLITGGLTVEGCSKEVFLLNFEKKGEIYQYSSAKLPSLSEGRYAHKAFAINSDTFLVAGGFNEKRKVVKTCEFYEKNAWIQGPELNKPRNQPSGFISQQCLYIFGGFSGPKTPENTIERLDLKERKLWEEISVKNKEFIAKTGCLCINTKGGVLVLGGSDGISAKDDIFFWDLEKNDILKKKEKMKNFRANFGGVLTGNGKVLVLGGEKDRVVKLEEIGLEKVYEAEIEITMENGDEECLFNEPGYFWFCLE